MALPSRIGRYEVLGELATGGMAEILLGRVTGQGGFERPVVIKRILPHLARQQEFVAMFLDEARIVAQIGHPNVVHVQELGQEGGELYLVMEYLEGESVAGLVKRLLLKQRAVSPSLAAFIIAEACAGLHAAHELVDGDGAPQRLVHRDVSPQNVFLTYQGQVKVIDFGVAKATDRIARTEAGQIKGKYEYMAPEQCMGGAVDRRSDVFALGVLLYELGTMRRLFKRFNQLLALKAITEEPVVPPSRTAPAFPARLEAICMRALARDPDARYASAADMRRELLTCIRELGTPGGVVEPSEELATLMNDVFADRIDEKRELLRRMRSGSAVTHVPAGEADTQVDVPGLDVGVDAGAGLTTGTGSSLDTPAGIPRRWGAGPAFAMAGVVLIAALGFAVVRLRSVRVPTAIPTNAAVDDPAASTATATPTATPTPTATATATPTPTAAASAEPRPGRRLRGPKTPPPPPPPTASAVAPPPPPPPDPAPAASKGFHRFE